MVTAIDIQKQERKNRRRARILAFLLLLFLLMAFILPFISAELETSQKYEKAIMIDFSQEFHDSRAAAERSSAEAAKAAAANETSSPEEPTEEEVAPVEEITAEEPIEEPETVEEIIEEPTIDPIPTPQPMEAVTDKKLITSESSDIPVNVRSMMKEISEKAVVKKVDKEVTEVTEGVSSSFMSDITKYFGNSSKSDGTSKSDGSGKSATAGEGKQGSSDRGDSDFDGKADSGISPSDFDYDGLLTRKVIRRADVKSLIKKTGRIVINLCVNRDGQVIYSKVDREATTLTDPRLIQQAETTAMRYRYEKDYTVASRQCGKLSFIVDIEK